LRRIRFLITPHRTSLRDSTTPCRIPAEGYCKLYSSEGRPANKQCERCSRQLLDFWAGCPRLGKPNDCARVRRECKAECVAGGGSVSDDGTNQAFAGVKPVGASADEYGCPSRQFILLANSAVSARYSSGVRLVKSLCADR